MEPVEKFLNVDGAEPIDGSTEMSALIRSVRSTLDALPGLAFALRPDGRIAFRNKAFRELLELSRNDDASARWRSVIHPDDLRASRRALQAALVSRSAFRIRQRIRSATGYRQYDTSISPYPDSTGAVRLWLGIATDVEEHARVSLSLVESERRLRVFLETIPVILWTADATGWIDWYNPHWYAFTGQSREEAAGWGWQAAHHPDDFGEVMRRWPHSIATGEPFEMEFRLRRADGVYRWMLTRIVPLRDSAGAIVRWYGSNTDIDDQKRAQQRTTRVAELLQQALLPQSLPAGDGYRFDSVYRAAESEARIGGDWFDAQSLPDGRIAMSIGDVTGHGIEAAAHAARLRQAISFAALEDADPVRILTRVNRLVIEQGLEIATAGVAVVDPTTMTIRYALAGHPPPAIAFANGVGRMGDMGGTPLGLDPGFKTVEHVVTLPPDAIFAFYTDGVTEHDRNIERAEAALARAASDVADDPARHARPALSLYDAVLAGKPNTDDAAIVTLQARGAAVREPKAAPGLTKTWRFHSSHALSAHTARRELSEYLRTYATDSEAVFEAELVIGEILANTVRHAPGLVEIEIDWRTPRPRLRASDSGSSGVPHDSNWPSDPLADRGRGLPIIFAFASDVAIAREPSGGGSTISCTLPIERTAGPAR